MEETTREIGGNSIKLWLGNKLAKWGERLITKGSKLIVSNPTCKLHSPYLLVINFTVNNTEKYTLTLQGDYKERYKLISNSLKENEADSVEVDGDGNVDGVEVDGNGNVDGVAVDGDGNMDGVEEGDTLLTIIAPSQCEGGKNASDC